MAQFLSYIQELKKPSVEFDLQPDVDERDEKEERELRESEDLSRGAVLKGVVSEGHGESKPRDGDLVFVHYTVCTVDEKVLESTRSSAGGSGQPRPFVLGKGKRAPRAWELALNDMTKGERVVLRVKPEYGYAHKTCGFEAPSGAPSKETLVFDLELVNWHDKDGVRVIANDSAFKKVLVEADSWENPRPPYEVELLCALRVLSSDAQLGSGKLLFDTGDQQLNVALGGRMLPEGVEECVCSMTKGETAAFIIPAHMTEGGKLFPIIPASVQWLEVQLQLLQVTQVRDLTGRGDVIKRRLQDGTGEFPMDCPLEDSRVRLHYKARPAGTTAWILDTRGKDGQGPPLEFDTGMGLVPEAVDMCVRLMLPGEVSLVTSKARYAYAARSDAPDGIDPAQEVQFQVELLGFDKMPAWVEMAAEDKLQQAMQLKEQGNKLFKDGHYKFAEQKYVKASKVLTSINNPQSVEQVNRISAAKVSVLTNLALVAHKEMNYGVAIDWCNRAMKEDPDQPKPYFRRAVSHSYLGRYEEAAVDLATALELDPSLQEDVEKEVAAMEKRRKAADNKQRKELSSFLNKRT